MLLLVPTDPLRPNRPDEHFAAEAKAAREAGLDVALIDHDALTRGEAVVRKMPASEDAVYRGWMMRSDQYAALAEALRRRDVTLRTSPEQYRRAHELPGWYADLETLTPQSVWTSGDDRTDFEKARRELGEGPAVLRDYTKSMKHHWTEAAFIPDLADAEAAWTVARRFRELRGEDMVGGFVLRRFERFVSAEVRTWWVNGVCRLVGPHPDTPDDMPEGEPPRVDTLGLPFVTADFVVREDGTWRLVELGDGQVSDRPRTVPAEEMISILHT